MKTAWLPRLPVSLAAVAMTCWVGGVAAETPPDTDNGRYTMSPITDGVMRLDTRTGEISTCSNNGNGWACYIVPDERAALDAEIGRLQADNEKLKGQLADGDATVAGKTDQPKTYEPKTYEPKTYEPKAYQPNTDQPKIVEALPKADALKKPEPNVADAERKIEIPKIEIPLPSDRDMDRAMSFLENAWRRLVEMANRVQRDVNGGRI